MAGVWALVVGAVVALDAWTLLNEEEGDTLSECVRVWAAGHWLRRVVLLAVMVWLAWHLGTRPAVSKSKMARDTVLARERELEALELRKTGVTYQAIGQRMGLSETGRGRP